MLRRYLYHNRKQQLFAFVLLTILAATFFPAGLLHHHHHATEEVCDPENTQQENNPCHISVYHTYDLHKTRCEHDKHIHEQLPHCEVCKHLSSQHGQVYLPSSEVKLFFTYTTTTLSITEERSVPLTYAVSLLNKGPPRC